MIYLDSSVALLLCRVIDRGYRPCARPANPLGRHRSRAVLWRARGRAGLLRLYRFEGTKRFLRAAVANVPPALFAASILPPCGTALQEVTVLNLLCVEFSQQPDGNARAAEFGGSPDGCANRAVSSRNGIAARKAIPLQTVTAMNVRRKANTKACLLLPHPSDSSRYREFLFSLFITLCLWRSVQPAETDVQLHAIGETSPSWRY
jgi:hypothetical protein